MSASIIPASALETAWASRWREVAAAPASATRDRALASLLEELAGRDSSRALAIVAAERNRHRRLFLRDAALRGWSTKAPRAAAAWVFLNHAGDPDQRDAALAAVLTGASRQPDAAIDLIAELDRRDPANAYAHANTLVRALANRGDFAATVRFAGSTALENRGELINTAFGAWGAHQPEKAAAAALALADERERANAWRAVIGGWAPNEPQTLAEYALRLPPGVPRAEALGESLRHWVLQDTAAASAWMDRLDPSPELDAGAAAVANFAPLILRDPQIAISWAESIVDPVLRAQTLTSVVREWSRHDHAAATHFADSRQLGFEFSP